VPTTVITAERCGSASAGGEAHLPGGRAWRAVGVLSGLNLKTACCRCIECGRRICPHCRGLVLEGPLIAPSVARSGVTTVHGGQHCTLSDAQRFYSHRRDGRCGRMASLIWIDAESR
jgi:hypothetical protein